MTLATFSGRFSKKEYSLSKGTFPGKGLQDNSVKAESSTLSNLMILEKPTQFQCENKENQHYD